MKSNLYFIGFVVIAGYTAHSYADMVSVHNTTDETLYAAVYYVRNDAERVTKEIVAIEPGKTAEVERPARKYWYDRELAYTADPETLKEKFSKITFDTVAHVNIGLVQGSHFYITSKNGRLKSFTALQWHITHPITKVAGALTGKMTEPVREYIKNNSKAVEENPYKDMVAEVRLGNEISLFEKDFLKKRHGKVKGALENVLGMPLDGKCIPQIAVVASGGGYRAALVTLGFFLGLDALGLVDGITYAAGLSGSTWMIGPWFASGKPLDEYAGYLRNALGEKLASISKNELVMMVNALLVKLSFNQPITLVDLYGLVLGNKLLKSFGIDRYRTYLSAQRERVANGEWFFPLYTCVEGRAAVRWDTPWFEFNPYEIGSADYEAYVPSWSFGRRFVGGESVDFAPEQPLSFGLGTFGSAFAASVDFIWNEMKNDINVPFLKSVIENTLVSQVGGHRLSWGQVYNFMVGLSTSDVMSKKSNLMNARAGVTEPAGMGGATGVEEDEEVGAMFPQSASPTSAMRNEKYIKLVDGGLGHSNLPYPVVSGMRPDRRPDILIFVDGSSGITGASELRKVEEYARNYGLLFPTINYDGIDKRTISIFKDEENMDVPVVIYLPRYNDAELAKKFVSGEMEGEPGQEGFERFAKLQDFDADECVSKEFCGTFNLQWKLDEAQEMSDLLEFNVLANQPAILDAIKWTIENHMPREW
jgi:phospholipase A2